MVLTDNPVCQTTGVMPGGQVTLVPLSKHHILIGGLLEAVEQWRTVDIDQLNVFLAAWAEKSIFAADCTDLEVVKLLLGGSERIQSEEWLDAARRPFFGLPDRMYLRQPPSGEALRSWWDEIKDSFGTPLSDH